METPLVLELAKLVSFQSTLLAVIAGFLLCGMVVLGLQLRAVSADLKAIAAMTAEVLRRTPPQP